jgi:hypothetical protein
MAGARIARSALPAERGLVDRVHDRRVRDDAHEVRGEPAVQRARALLREHETERLHEPGVLEAAVDERLAQARADDLWAHQHIPGGGSAARAPRAGT